jgi:hypothetical protein
VCFSNTCNIFFSVVLVSVLHTCDVFSLGCKFQYMHCFYSRVIVSAIPTYIIVILFSKVLVAVIHTENEIIKIIYILLKLAAREKNITCMYY